MHLEDILNTFESSKLKNMTQLESHLKDIIHFTKDIPHPAQGQTYQRWQVFSQVAHTNLTLAKWFESHCDALSILNELKIENIPQGVWAVWAAEGSQNPLRFHNKKITGEKLWCSGADLVDYGLMTLKDNHNKSQLCIVNMQEDGISIDHSHWQAIGMSDTKTARLNFSEVPVEIIGQSNEYLTRLGFWHGAAGVAACWFGATVRIASVLRDFYETKQTPYNAMYMGEVSAEIFINKRLFKQLANKIDQQPHLTHELEIRILRVYTEKVAKKVIELVGNALGARPFCENAIFAQLVADLPVFLRQSHAAYDLAKIAELSSVAFRDYTQRTDHQEFNPWML